MISMIRRILVFLLGLLLILSILLGALGVFTVRRSFPQASGEIQVPGLDAPVEVYRDSYGIPHIYASNRHDLFFAQGYLHAQDRFWQMDFWRHIGSGRLAEMLPGEDQVESDKFLRTLGWARVVEKELQRLDATSLSILQAYADGVNAYLEGRSGSELSLEYAVLQLINPDYRPEPWQPLHSLTWGKVMAWDLGGNLDSEIERALLLKELSVAQLDEIIPPYPADRPVILPGFTALEGSPDPRAADPGALESLSPALQAIQARMAALDRSLGQREQGLGSNSWVVSGRLTATGVPLLANDPHLGAQMPSIWYEVGLHCTPISGECPYNVAGFSFAGAPGVIIGHNDRVAWGFTNLGPDVMDLYIEKINPHNPNQYEVNGRWVDMELVKESILVAGGEPIEQTVRYTRHGPIISDTYLPEAFDQQAGIELPDRYAIALRWTALEPYDIFRAIWGFNRARNWDEFRAAARRLAVPAQNLVYADIDGHIGYQMPGLIPRRAAGDGRLPVPGWTDEYEWEGYIPFVELPFAFDPPAGYIVTANNAVVGPDYPNLISMEWAYGARAQRIEEMIESAPGPIDRAYIQSMQGDNKNLNAATLVPILLQIPEENPGLEQARQLLENWDYQQEMDSAPAAVFEAFWKHLLAETFHDDLPEDYWPEGGGRWAEVVRRLVEQPDSAWWDDRETAAVENRDMVFRLAFASAVGELQSRLGSDLAELEWGELHTLTLVNQTLGRSGIAPIEALFNRGPYRTAGGSDIVNATSWNAAMGYQVRSLPSMRMIVDLRDLSNSLSIHTTGQSGHAYHPHYADMTDLWRTIQYHPMLWSREQIEAEAEGFLRLVP